ncbi:hypothetical protein DPEC_G00316670 [Dallia pectoralis]|uniref:Uncharacterized protein n=1 Tax=Dallia pectoralis TaxID=75939 RepID=A0ACC2FCU0_DALPE|nr:hypothetical protein DPEC_G00316670 [Dallia pectoralis]
MDALFPSSPPLLLAPAVLGQASLPPDAVIVPPRCLSTDCGVIRRTAVGHNSSRVAGNTVRSFGCDFSLQEVLELKTQALQMKQDTIEFHLTNVLSQRSLGATTSQGPCHGGPCRGGERSARLAGVTLVLAWLAWWRQAQRSADSRAR